MQDSQYHPHQYQEDQFYPQEASSIEPLPDNTRGKNKCMGVAKKALLAVGILLALGMAYIGAMAAGTAIGANRSAATALPPVPSDNGHSEDYDEEDYEDTKEEDCDDEEADKKEWDGKWDGGWPTTTSETTTPEATATGSTTAGGSTTSTKWKSGTSTKWSDGWKDDGEKKSKASKSDGASKYGGKPDSKSEKMDWMVGWTEWPTWAPTTWNTEEWEPVRRELHKKKLHDDTSRSLRRRFLDTDDDWWAPTWAPTTEDDLASWESWNSGSTSKDSKSHKASKCSTSKSSKPKSVKVEWSDDGWTGTSSTPWKKPSSTSTTTTADTVSTL